MVVFRPPTLPRRQLRHPLLTLRTRRPTRLRQLGQSLIRRPLLLTRPAREVRPKVVVVMGVEAEPRLTPSLLPQLKVYSGLVSLPSPTEVQQRDDGLMRAVPFAIKAEQGDTLEYIWGGGPVSSSSSGL